MFFYGISTPILWTMIADVADYSEWKNNRRATAIIFAAMMIGLKGGLSIGSALLTKILNIFDYQPGSTTGQSAETINGIKMLVSVFPSISFFIAFGLLFFYEINKNMEGQIQSDLEKRRG
jgi:Na+/melibiose symporter-like transporter